MGTALFTGVTGLLAFQRKLDVVANNISNVGTTGYRGSRVLFQDLFSQTLMGASAPTGTFGGTNPMQVGLGVQLGTIDVNHAQGSLTTTGIASDLAIQGSGMFILSDGLNDFYTRDGSFALNSDGFLIDPATGLFVQGFGVDANGNIDEVSGIGNLQIPLGGQSIVQATTLANLLGNLDSGAAVGDVVSRTVTVFDSLGTPRDVTITFTKRVQVDDGGTDYNAWQFEVTFNGTDVTNLTGGGAVAGVVLFDMNGQFHAAGGVDDADPTMAANFVPQAAATDPTVSIPITEFTGPSIPTVPFEFSFDFSDITELSNPNDITLSTQNGFPRGVLEAFSIGEGGVINGLFTNGLTRTLGQIGLATFANVAGLERFGSNLFRETVSSGLPQVGLAGTGGRGDVRGGVLEGSNVDLATEFSNMIITQRGYQANARTITAADTLLQETVNLVR